MRKLTNGLVIPDDATVLDCGTRGEKSGVVDYAVWFIDMIAYKGEAAVILQVTQRPTDPPVIISTGVILTRSMIQQMQANVSSRAKI